MRSPPSTDQLAHLFLQLAQLESAGIPAVKAFTLLDHRPGADSTRLRHMQNLLKAGASIAEAGFKTGLFNDNHRALIHAAEGSGQLTTLYRKLATHYGDRTRLIKKIKSRMSVPILTLILALLVQPLPALVGRHIGIEAYLAQSVGALTMLVLSAVLLLRLPGIFEALGWLTLWHRLQLRLPLVANWLETRQLNGFFFMLAMMLDAGLAFSDALPKAVASIDNTALKQQFAAALACPASGDSVAATLARVPTIKPSMLQIIATAEHSGKLAESLLHFYKINTETIALQDESLAEWLPRVIYGFVAAWMANGMLTAHPWSIPPTLHG